MFGQSVAISPNYLAISAFQTPSTPGKVAVYKGYQTGTLQVDQIISSTDLSEVSFGRRIRLGKDWLVTDALRPYFGQVIHFYQRSTTQGWQLKQSLAISSLPTDYPTCFHEWTYMATYGSWDFNGQHFILTCPEAASQDPRAQTSIPARPGFAVIFALKNGQWAPNQLIRAEPGEGTSRAADLYSKYRNFGQELAVGHQYLSIASKNHARTYFYYYDNEKFHFLKSIDAQEFPYGMKINGSKVLLGADSPTKSRFVLIDLDAFSRP